MDKIKVTILSDGTLKIETDRVSGPNHANAEALLREIIIGMGGNVDQKRKTIGHHHHEEGQKSHDH